jgi:DNA-binding NarL/FixJ family response regulator
VHAALRAGADGFLLKNSHPDDLARVLHAAVGKEPVLAPSVTRRLIDTLTTLPPAFLTDTPDAPPAPGARADGTAHPQRAGLAGTP